jgi:subtilisin family serine protease
MKSKLSLSILIIVISLSYHNNAFSQEDKGSKSMFKILVKDGKITNIESLDTTKNLLQISNINGENHNQNSAVHTSMNEDSTYNPNKAFRTSMNEDPNYNPNSAIRTTTYEIMDNFEIPDKGNNLPEKTVYAEAIFDQNFTDKTNLLIEDEKETQTSLGDIRTLAAWETILTESFEGSFPGTSWSVLASGTDAYWDDQSFRSNTGSWSGWCADAGTESVSPGSNYLNDMDTWMISGPFDLSDANDADLSFKSFIDTESSYDYFKYLISVDGSSFHGFQTSGNSGGWVDKSIDLKNVPILGDVTGQSQVWIAFVFESNSSVNSYEGAYIDDILLQKYTTASTSPDLAWTSMTLSTSSWTEGNSVTAGLTVGNSGDGSAGSQYSRIYLSTNDIISSTDVLLGSDIFFSSISAGSSQTQNSTFTVPTVTDGTYWVGALVDFYDVVVESDESNNGGAGTGQVTIMSVNTDYIDLVPISISLSTDEWLIGNSIAADITEINTGTILADDHFTRLLLSDNQIITNSDTQIGSDIFFSSIAAGASITISTSFIVPDVDEGVYYVGIMTDVHNTIAESSESNNIQYRVGTVNVETDANIPDISLSVSSLTINEASDQSISSVMKSSDNPNINSDYVSNQLLVKFKSNVYTDLITQNTGNENLNAFNAKYQVSLIKQIGNSYPQSSNPGKTHLVRYEGKTNIYNVIKEYESLDMVEYAEPDYLVTNSETIVPFLTSNDPLYNRQWGLNNTVNAISYYGSSVGTIGEDINIEPAWDITQGSSNIIVAVIDDGVDLTHSEFAGRLVSGYDFVNSDNDANPLSTDGHGNACAGIIAAANDGMGVVGVAPFVKIMPIKSMENSSGNTSDIIDGIYFAVDHGARVISMSLGGGSYSNAFKDAIIYANNNGVVVLAAAGNDGTDNQISPYYPSSYENSISVGAMSPCGLRKSTSTCDEEFWWGSNYGDIDFITPGTRIYTTDISGSGGYSSTDYTSSFNGTSAATPFAAGIAALILSVDPSLNPAEVRQIMQSASVDIGENGYDSETGYGRLDAFAALQLAQTGGSLLTITNQGSGILTVDEITTDQSWLSTNGFSTPFDLHSGESKVVTVNVDWSQISISENAIINISSNDNDEPSIDVTVTANPTEVVTYAITAASSPSIGGIIDGTGDYGLNQTAILTATPAPRYVFVNWTESGTEVSANASYNFTVDSDRALIANFILETYSISVSANPIEGGTVTGGGPFEYGETVILEATSYAAYHFINWTENDEVISNDATYSFSVTESRSLVAYFSIDPYEISVSSNPSTGGTINGAGMYLDNQIANLVAAPQDGYDFINWTEDDTEISTLASYIFTVTGDRTLVANFELKTLNVSVSNNPTEGGLVAGIGSYEYGQTATLVATPATGYDFVNWTEDGAEVSTELIYSFNVLKDRSLVANFLIQSFDISSCVDPTGGGTVTGGGTFEYGETVTLTANPATWYDFINWTVNGAEVSTELIYSFAVTENFNPCANFLIQSFDITVSPSEGGSVSGDGSYDYGQTATLVATPATGYDFVNWTEDGAEVSTELIYSFNVWEERNLVANFVIQSFEISASADPVDRGTVSGSGTYDYGQSATLEATPGTGYNFFNWTEDGTEISTETSLSFTVSGARNLVANFTVILSVNDLISEIKVYPNPVKTNLVIEWTDFTEAIVSELSGKELIRMNTQTLDLRTLNAGVYLITLIGTNNERITFRIIKE